MVVLGLVLQAGCDPRSPSWRYDNRVNPTPSRKKITDKEIICASIRIQRARDSSRYLYSYIISCG